MENASDALIMAGQVLIFIIALTICISSFTTLRVGIDGMMDETEIIKLSKDSDLYINYIQSRDEGATRIVGSETVISSMYRAIKEDFTMYIEFKDNDLLNNLETELKNTRYDVYGNEIPPIELIRSKDNLNRLEIRISTNANYRSHSILANGFYKRIKNLKFKEYLGEYQENADPGVSSENKMVKRIITYVEQ